MNHSTPGLLVHHQLLEPTQTHVQQIDDAIQPSHPLWSPSPPSLNPSQHQGLFKWVRSSHQVAKVLEFQLQHQSSNEHPGLISFRMDWLDLLAVQGTLKSLLQHHSSKASILRHSVFFTVQLSHPYMTTKITSPKWAMAPHSSTLAWKIPWMEEPGGLQSMGSLRVGHDWATSLSLFTFMHWRRKRQPTPVFLPENPRDGGAWWAAVYGVAQSRTRLKWLSNSSRWA